MNVNLISLNDPIYTISPGGILSFKSFVYCGGTRTQYSCPADHGRSAGCQSKGQERWAPQGTGRKVQRDSHTRERPI